MITLPELAAEALGSFLDSDMKDRIRHFARALGRGRSVRRPDGARVHRE